MKTLLGYTVNEKAPRLIDINSKLELPFMTLRFHSSGVLGYDILFSKGSEIEQIAKQKRVFKKWFKPVIK